MKKGGIFTIAFSLVALVSFSQNQRVIDSLEAELDKARDLSKQIELYNQIGGEYYAAGSYQKAIQQYDRGLKLYDPSEHVGLSDGYRRIAACYSRLEDIDQTISYYRQAINHINKAEGEFDTKGRLLMQLGRAHYGTAVYDSAMHYYMQAKQIYDDNEIHNHNHGVLFHYIGSVFKRQDNYEKACEWYNQEFRYGREHDLPEIEAEAIYLSAACSGDPKIELEQNLEALRIYTEMGDERFIGLMHNNVAQAYKALDNYEKALEHQLEAVELHKSGGASHYASALSNLADTYIHLGQPDNALIHLKKAEELAKQSDLKKFLRFSSIYENMAQAYKVKNDYQQALKYTELWFIYRDSAEQADFKRHILELETVYETSKKDAELAAQTAEAEHAKAEQMKAERDQAKSAAALEHKEAQEHETEILLIGLFVVLALVGAFGFIMFRRFKVTREQNKVIEEQKLIVMEKNSEIMDSINYARRIQTAILPPKRLVKELLPDSFVLFKPKDVVAGDFYWIDKPSGGTNMMGDTIIFAAADCTGHGVPGAMVSVVCHNALNRAVKEFGMRVPGEILDKTRELVAEQFGKNDEAVKDGMDVALCSLNPQTNVLHFAGANNPLWLIRNSGTEVEVIEGTKQAVGILEDPIPFETKTVHLGKGDCIYIFTDGFTDQFGGGVGKKYKAKPFKDMLMRTHIKSMAEQHDLIDQEFENWRGDLEQVDDVCVFGLRV